MQRVAHLHARAGDVARAFRQSADHEDEALRADRGGFVDGAAVVVDRGAAGGFMAAGNMPPRQSPVTVMSCARMSFPARSGPHACTMSRQGEIAETPARAQPSTSCSSDHAFTVIELMERSARSCDRSRISRSPRLFGRHRRA